MLFGYDFADFSKPIDLTWLNYLSEIQLDKRIYIVGSGVTATEYAFVLLRAGIRYDQIDIEELENILLTEQKIFVLVSSPVARKKIESLLIAHGFQQGVDYFNHLHALRNRAVIDLRYWPSFDVDSLAMILNSLIDMPTVGGVDFLIDDSSFVDEIESVLNRVVCSLHTKITFYPRKLEVWDFSGVTNVHSLEINLLEFFTVNVLDFIAGDGAVKVLNGSEKVHLMLAQDEALAHVEIDRVYFEKKYPWYFDDELSRAAFGPCIDSSVAPQRCLSRRMFPAFGGDFSLKLCSLYDGLAKTSMSFAGVFSSEYIAARNALCARCAQKGLHRLA